MFITALKTIFGAGDFIKTVGDTIDAVHTSDEEMVKAKTQAKIDLMTAYAPFKVAQRWIALMFTLNFFLAFWVAVGLWGYAAVSGSEALPMDEFLEIMGTFQIGWAMLAIITFYFGGGLVEGGAAAIKKK